MPSFRSYTCYGCHDAEEMRPEHFDEGIRALPEGRIFLEGD